MGSNGRGMIIGMGYFGTLTGKGFPQYSYKPLADTGFERNLQYFFKPRFIFLFFSTKNTQKPGETDELLSELKKYRAMVALFNIGVNFRSQDTAGQVIGHVNIIDPPTFIIQPD